MRRHKYGNRSQILLIIAGIVSAVGLLGWWGFKIGFNNLFYKALNGFFNLLINIAGFFFFEFGRIAAYLINSFAVANPFSTAAFAPIVWDTFKNIAYVVLVFMSLYVGILYIVQREEQTKRLLFNIILVALLINFSFFLAKEIFMVFHTITVSLACLYGSGTGNCNSVGTAIFTSLAPLDASGDQKAIMESLFEQNSQNSAEPTHNQLILAFGMGLTALTLYFIWTAFMFMFVGIFLGRFIIIALLAGFLPLALVSLATPWYKSYWDRWWTSFLKWCAIPVILLLLILIGFGLIIQAFTLPANTGSTTGSAQTDSFLDLVDKGNDKKISASIRETGGGTFLTTGLVTLFRFVFIIAYYAAVIYIASNMGGRFAGFGFNAAKWAWAGLVGGMFAAGGRALFDPIRSGLGKGISDLGDKMTASGIPGVWRAGKALSKTGQAMQKGKKEYEEEVSKAIFEQYKNDPARLRQEIQRFAQKQKYGMLKNLVSEIDWDTEEWVQHISQIPTVLADNKVRTILAKKWRGFAATDNKTMGEALSKVNIGRAGGWQQVSTMIRNIPNVDADQSLQEAWLQMPDYYKRSFGRNLEHFAVANDPKFNFHNDPDYARGFVTIPELSPVMRPLRPGVPSLGQAITLALQGGTDNINKAGDILNKIDQNVSPQTKDAACNQIRSSIPNRAQRAALVRYIDNILNSASLPNLTNIGIDFR